MAASTADYFANLSPGPPTSAMGRKRPTECGQKADIDPGDSKGGTTSLTMAT